MGVKSALVINQWHNVKHGEITSALTVLFDVPLTLHWSMYRWSSFLTIFGVFCAPDFDRGIHPCLCHGIVSSSDDSSSYVSFDEEVVTHAAAA